MDCLVVEALLLTVDVGGPIKVLPVVLNLDFVLESDVRAVVAGVPVRGVEALEVVEEGTILVGDFVGDYTSMA